MKKLVKYQIAYTFIRGVERTTVVLAPIISYLFGLISIELAGLLTLGFVAHVVSDGVVYGPWMRAIVAERGPRNE